MKKILLALAILAGIYGSVGAQTLQSTISSLTDFNPYSPPVTVKQVAKVYHKKKMVFKPVTPENFKVCSGSTGYFICTETPGNANATHPKLVISLPKAGIPGDRLYDLPPAPLPPDSSAIPEEQSYPPKLGDLSAGAYEVLYPDIHFIQVGKHPKVVPEYHFSYENIPEAAHYYEPAKSKGSNGKLNYPDGNMFSNGGSQ